jgi:hypothetical protein
LFIVKFSPNCHADVSKDISQVNQLELESGTVEKLVKMENRSVAQMLAIRKLAFRFSLVANKKRSNSRTVPAQDNPPVEFGRTSGD